MKFKKLCKLGIVILFITLFFISLQPLSLSTTMPLENQNFNGESPYPMNENGQTYGPDIYGSSTIEPPDLMAAYGIDGSFGYVLASNFESKAHTPEEAIEEMKNTPSPRYIPLYDKDGKTVIGTFKIGN